MSDLTDARAMLAALLNDVPNVRAVTEIPSQFTPPICWVTSGTPYRQRAQAVGKKRINLVVVCLGGMSTNDASDAATEELAESVADAIDRSTTFWLDPSSEMDSIRMYPTTVGQAAGIAVNVMCESSRG